jgi:hypothetical protein
MNYQKTLNGVTVERDGTRYFIPADPQNMDYVAYLEWVAQGNTATNWTPPPMEEITIQS